MLEPTDDLDSTLEHNELTHLDQTNVRFPKSDYCDELYRIKAPSGGEYQYPEWRSRDNNRSPHNAPQRQGWSAARGEPDPTSADQSACEHSVHAENDTPSSTASRPDSSQSLNNSLRIISLSSDHLITTSAIQDTPTENTAPSGFRFHVRQLRQQVPAGVLIAGVCQVLSCVFYSVAFSTYSWGRAMSGPEDDVIVRDVGLWQVCHSLTGCSPLIFSSLTAAQHAARAFAVLGIITIPTSMLLSIIHIFFRHCSSWSHIAAVLPWLKICNCVFVLCTISIYATSWYKPLYISSDFRQSIDYSCGLAILSLLLEVGGACIYGREALNDDETLEVMETCFNDTTTASRGEFGDQHPRVTRADLYEPAIYEPGMRMPVERPEVRMPISQNHQTADGIKAYEDIEALRQSIGRMRASYADSDNSSIGAYFPPLNQDNFKDVRPKTRNRDSTYRTEPQGDYVGVCLRQQTMQNEYARPPEVRLYRPVKRDRAQEPINTTQAPCAPARKHKKGDKRNTHSHRSEKTDSESYFATPYFDPCDADKVNVHRPDASQRPGQISQSTLSTSRESEI